MTPVLTGRHERCTRLGGRSPGATTAPEGEDHVKAQASLGCKRNALLLTQRSAPCLDAFGCVRLILKREHTVVGVWQGITSEDSYAFLEHRICVLYEYYVKISPLEADASYSDGTTIRKEPESIRTQKRCNKPLWKYTIIQEHHEHTPRGEGASEGCRPKLPR
jgi:hypothetical protein